MSYVLAQRKKKMGRNVNLVMAFCFTCFIWIVSLMVKLRQDLFELYAELKLPPWERYRFPVDNNIFASSILSFSPCFTSIFSPFILFVVQKNYRKPIADFFKKIREKICKWNEMKENDMKITYFNTFVIPSGFSLIPPKITNIFEQKF